MPSPTAEINSTSLGGWTGTTSGAVAVAAGETVSVRLADHAGVGVWQLTVIGTDDQVVAPTITQAASASGTATFTAPTDPGSGWGLIIRTQIGRYSLGHDANGVLQTSYTGSFKVYLPTSGGQQVVCANETTEGNPTHGWVAPLNQTIRSPGGPPSGAASGDWSGSFPSGTNTRINGQRVPWKSTVTCVSTSNITLSGEQTIDGVLTSASRVLVAGQTTASQNGIYLSASGAWSRASDMSSSSDCMPGSTIHVSQGTAYKNSSWVLGTTGGITLGSTSLTFYPAAPDAYVKRFGAKVDGVTHDDAAVAAAIASLPANGGRVVFPPGDCVVDSTILVSSKSNVHLVGSGRLASRIIATSSVVTSTLGNGETTGAVVKFLNCYACGVYNLGIEGASGAAATRPSCVESRRDSLSHTCSQLTVEGCQLGSDSGVRNLHGIRYTCADSTTDANNENGQFRDNIATNLAGAGLSIEHSNSLGHEWHGGIIATAAHAFRLRGGSFSAKGARISVGSILYSLGASATAMVDFGTPTFDGVGGYSGFYDHASSVIGCLIEGVDQLLHTNTFSKVQMLFHGGGVQGAGTAGGDYVVDFNSAVGIDLVRPQVTFDNFTLICGGATCPVRCTDAASVLTIRDCTGVGFTNVTFAGTFIHHNNRWLPGSPTFTPSNGAFEIYYAEKGGGFTQTDVVNRLRSGGVWVNSPVVTSDVTASGTVSCNALTSTTSVGCATVVASGDVSGATATISGLATCAGIKLGSGTVATTGGGVRAAGGSSADACWKYRNSDGSATSFNAFSAPNDHQLDIGEETTALTSLNFRVHGSANTVCSGTTVGTDSSSQRLDSIVRYSYRTGLGVSLPLAYGILNDTAAANGAQQAPGVIELEGRGWATGAGASQQVRFQLSLLPVQGSTVDGTVAFGLNLNNGGFTYPIKFNSTGVGFNNVAPVARQTVTGSRGGNAALADLLTKLANTGLIIDGTSA